MTQPFLGELRVFPWDFAVRGWALAQGQIVSIQQNQALFSLLGTVYGGNGVTTFQLPDLRSRVSVGVGQLAGGSQYTLGERTGVESVQLTVSTMPQHNHMWQASTSNGNQQPPLNGYLATIQRPQNVGAVPGYAAPSGNAIGLGTAIANNGGNQPHPNIQPYLCMNYSIALQGIFPSRN